MSAATTHHPPLVGFIGAGNIARALAGGLINSGWDRSRLILSDPDAAQRDGVAQLLGLEVHADNAAVAARADILVFAVKPQALAVAATALATVAQHKHPLVVSVAAGVRIGDLERWLGGNLPVVRVMPNTAVLVGAGACGLYANALVNETMREQAESILRAVGVTVWVEREEQLDLVTALSGSGPAYFFWSWKRSSRRRSSKGCRTPPRDCWRCRLLTAPPRWRSKVPRSQRYCAST